MSARRQTHSFPFFKQQRQKKRNGIYGSCVYLKICFAHHGYFALFLLNYFIKILLILIYEKFFCLLLKILPTAFALSQFWS
jgi:hypothetical protein